MNPDVTGETLLDATPAHPDLVNHPVVCTAKGLRLCHLSEAAAGLLGHLPTGPLGKEDGTMIFNEKGTRID